MPNGPNPKRPDYDDDFYAWTQHQATVLREMAVADNRFDREHVAEEIEDLGKSERDAVRSQVRRVIEHCLKLQYSPTQEPRASWMRSIAEARDSLGDKLSWTLRRDVQRNLPKLYSRACHLAFLGLQEYGERSAANRFPAECPYTLREILEEDWYPEPVEKT